MRACSAGLFLAFALGCSSQPAARPVEQPPSPDEEKAVRAQFVALQSAIEKKDADKLWALLDDKSHADAERAAKDIQTAHAKASDAEKTKQEEALGLTGADIAKLTGTSYLKSKRFQKRYHELPESKIEKVVVQGDNATVHYIEPDDDHEKLIFIRRDGQWKAWLAMPKVGAAN
jgi:hypothetical protein